MFMMKKIISALINPASILLILLFITLICIFFNKRRASITLLCCTLIVTYTLSITPTVNYLSGTLEHRYRILKTLPNSVRYIVVLSGGGNGRPDKGINRLNSITLNRTIAAEALSRTRIDHHPINIIVSGGRRNAAAMRATLISIGFPSQRVIVDGRASDTKDSAKNLKPILQHQRFVLVTSALHMPRAIQLFQGQQLKPIAAPTNFISYNKEAIAAANYLPTFSNLSNVSFVEHEYLGILWARLRGQTK
jgi:uncharacterized SAM-binding protein YcdF (DUF218 family)